MIKLLCSNENCGFAYHVTQAELENYGQYHRKCMLCGSQLKVDNLEEIVEKDIETTVRENVNKWFRRDGIEGTIEMIERNKDLAVYRLYQAELEKRGFKLKGD